ncbi:brevican core protein-like [Pecten maximus]|uniref:brevican core protein-like n=1 Tax=Pecten maximus TaxID=6579 RepID=UPI0014583E22|nr:brevican core protein-like [Pecten maximus]
MPQSQQYPRAAVLTIFISACLESYFLLVVVPELNKPTLLKLRVVLASGQIVLENNSGLENWFPNTALTTVGVVDSVIECGMLCKEAGFVSGTINGYNCDIVDDSCLKLLSNKRTWSFASAECASEGATLLYIDSNSEQLAIQQFMADQGLSNVWLGINDVTVEGDWRNEDGTKPSAYNNFKLGQPDDQFPGQDCGKVREKDGYEWDDDKCINVDSVICEIKKVGFP